MTDASPEALYPGLRLQALSRVPGSIRRIATAAAHGSLESLCYLQSFTNGPQIELYLPVIYANLDPAAIPNPDRVEGPPGPYLDENAVSAIIRAFISLLAISDNPLPRNDAMPQLWPRCWAWIQFLDLHYYSIPLSLNRRQIPFIPPDLDRGEQNNRVAYVRIVDAFNYHPEAGMAIDLTPGVRVLVAQVWRTLLRHAQIYGGATGLSCVCGFLSEKEPLNFQSAHPPTVQPHHRTHIEELAEGAGGGMDELATLVVEQISFVPADSADWILPMYQTLAFIRDSKFRGLLWEEEFRFSGLVKALIDAIPAVVVTDVNYIEDILYMCFDTLDWMIFSNLDCLSSALRNGLLSAIAACGKADIVVEPLRCILTHHLPACTIHYYVLLRMRAFSTEARSAVPGASSMFGDWMSLFDLVDERAVLLDFYDLGEPSMVSRACDNLECCAIKGKRALKRCGRCRKQYYCSELCQAADWRTGGHRGACALLIRRHKGASLYLPQHLRTRGRDFIRAILHHDYLKHKHHILLSQIKFLVAHPDQPNYVGFNYTKGRVKIDVYPTVGDVNSPWGVGNDVHDEREVERAQRSGGRYTLHRAFIGIGGMAFLHWFPLRATNAALDELVQRLAGEVDRSIDVDALKARLLEELAALERAEREETH
ncbi:hypothetical protein K438DRAFT_1814314 [Mycena galopus ATCC 62051]|nr:hypothetical protein K438DRAFT_1814314 [Mycena galopus ATCC 62051]